MGGVALAGAMAAGTSAVMSNQASKEAKGIRNDANAKSDAAKKKSDLIKQALSGADGGTSAGSRIAAEKGVMARRGKGSYAKSKSGGKLG